MDAGWLCVDCWRLTASVCLWHGLFDSILKHTVSLLLSVASLFCLTLSRIKKEEKMM